MRPSTRRGDPPASMPTTRFVNGCIKQDVFCMVAVACRCTPAFPTAPGHCPPARHGGVDARRNFFAAACSYRVAQADLRRTLRVDRTPSAHLVRVGRHARPTLRAACMRRPCAKSTREGGTRKRTSHPASAWQITPHARRKDASGPARTRRRCVDACRPHAAHPGHNDDARRKAGVVCLAGRVPRAAPVSCRRSRSARHSRPARAARPAGRHR